MIRSDVRHAARGVARRVARAIGAAGMIRSGVQTAAGTDGRATVVGRIRRGVQCGMIRSDVRYARGVAQSAGAGV
jgi:hypothetical protein